MSVLIVTSLGDIVIDLHTDRCPLTTKNFLKLCKIKYFNGCLFHTVQKDFTAQTGDPTGKGTGGDSIYKFLYGDQARFFGDEIHQDLKHSKIGTVAMASAGENLNASQFYFTLRDDLDYLDGKHTVFGEVAEGLETLTRINEAFVDDKGRPYKNIRIKHTYILDDPFDDPPQLAELIPDASPDGKPHDEIDDDVRLEDDWVPMDDQMDPAVLEEVLRAKEAHSSAVVLESIGDIPEAEIKPPDNVLFVCKLNPVTEDEDLHTIFSRFGNVISADIIRDFKTKESLCYAFIEFETKEACEEAYFKMDNALIDDRRIHVDFSQSVARLWSQYRRKENQMGKGSGCFKCGALDHISKDCTEGNGTKQLPSKYTLKDENTQRGGTDTARYDMVFDGDAPPNSEQLKLQQEFKPEDQRHRDREKKDGHWHDDKSRRYIEDERKRDSKESRDFGRKDVEYHRDRSETEKHRERENYKGHESRGDRRDERDYRKRSADGDDREEKDDQRDSKDDRDYTKRSYNRDGHGDRRVQDYRKKSADGDDREKRNDQQDSKDDRDYTKRSTNRDGRGDRRDVQDYRKRSADGGDHEERNDQRDSKDDRDYTKRSTNRDGRGDRRDVQDYRKRSADGDDHEERNDQRDSKDDRDYTKRSTNRDGRGDRRDERDYKKRNIDRDGHGERRDEREYKRHRDDRR
ncbi:peptidyl-prolyl cis-trans isomerase CYP59 isoform X2 [Telopea speciosissima]|uniref:peptidyl-prolyl cis-trans isomerase CYP59 isoform X2 n=1 Tax=Telopea speciosissima TaxID=54955 RepID=UPI001CC62772|nr:peptidyl-prolyl cis-trans isomerase CYP59 isoform X2 [Telopea speciosissima]